MKSLLGGFAKWFYRNHQRKRGLWEEGSMSVIAEDGYAARIPAANTDLNPVRADIVKVPAGHRWSGDKEAMGEKHTARAGLVRADGAQEGWHGSSKQWSEVLSEDFIYLDKLMGYKANLRADSAEAARLRRLALGGLAVSVASWEIVLEKIA